MNKPILALGLLTSVTAFADGKREDPATHNPPLYIDESSPHFDAYAHDGGYGAHVNFDLYGAGAVTDGVRVEWKQGNGKPVLTTKCTVNQEAGRYPVACETNQDVLKLAGAVTADVVYIDDASDKQYLVRSFKLNVAHWTDQGTHPNFQFLPDDAMGIAYAWNDPDGYRNDVRFSFWSTNKLEGSATTFRCKVGGKQLDDFKMSLGSDRTGGVDVDVLPKSGARLTIHYKHPALDVEEMKWGTRAAYKGNLTKDKLRFLGDNPGDWTCDARVEGTVIRQFAFAVGADGLIQSAAIQSGKNPLHVPPGTVVVAMTIPKGIEEHFRPAAVKGSAGYGAPWPDHPDVKKWLAALPPQVGADVK